MPFDDTDVKKMIKIQLEGKLKYPSKITDKIDPLVKDLISLMLEPDVTKRANIDKVMKHCWLNSS
jgi:serine kinase